MSDHIDELIEKGLKDFRDEYGSNFWFADVKKATRAVAEAAYKAGKEAMFGPGERAAQERYWFGKKDGRREFAREALEKLKRQWAGEKGYNAGTFGTWLREQAGEESSVQERNQTCEHGLTPGYKCGECNPRG